MDAVRSAGGMDIAPLEANTGNKFGPMFTVQTDPKSDTETDE